MSDEAPYRKTANAFVIPRDSVSLIIQKVSKTIVKFLGKDYTELPETSRSGKSNTKIFKTLRIPTMYRSIRWYTHTNKST